MYWNYAMKCIIRNIIYKLMKPRNLFIIGVSLVIIFFLSSYTNVFGYQGNNEYTDKNATIAQAYESINIDFVQRLYQSYNNTAKDNLLYHLKDKDYSYYLYYGQSDGSQMISATMYNPQVLNIIIYNNSSRVIGATAWETYQGMTTNIATVENSAAYFYFNGNGLTQGTIPNMVYLPYVLINYHSQAITDFFLNDTTQQTNEIVGAINQQTNTIQEQTEVIQEQTDAMTSTDYDDSVVDIDTSSADVDNSQQTGLFTTIFTNFNNSIQSDEVEYINIPLPHNSGNLSIPSNIVSSHLGGLSLLVNAFWMYVFGFYAFKFVNNLIIKIKDGSILDGYNTTDVITSDMM